MHVAAAAAAQSVLASEELSEHWHDRHAPDHESRRTAVSQGEAIAFAEEGDDPGRRRLLSGTEVHFTGDEPAVPQILDRELVVASSQHFAVKAYDFHGFRLEEDSTVV